MFNTTLGDILATMHRKAYRVFEKGNYNVNIVGIRNPERQAGRYDDTLALFYKVDGQWTFHLFPITTDPGSFYLETPLEEVKKKGAAILKEGQYVGVYTIAKHRGLYDALCQKLGPVTVYRDNNRDRVLDFDRRSEETGNFAINIHKSGHDDDPLIGRSSAGCQVFCDHDQFKYFMSICKRSRDIFSNKFTYTLLNESDFQADLEAENLNNRIVPERNVTDNNETDQQDIVILAKTIFGEARGESDQGKIAVGWVVMNRVAFAQNQPRGDYWWGNTIRKVCLKSQQFSCWNANDPNRKVLDSLTVNNNTFKRCIDIAKEVVAGRASNPIDGATHYFAEYIRPPGWTRCATFVGKIGVHSFYKDVG